MCFSTEASFGAGAVLTVIGIATIKTAQSPSHRFFASIPFLFAMQQISEGFLWLSLSNPLYAPLQQASTFVFLFFAEILWPIWVPFAVYKLEPLENRKKILKIFIGLGAFVSLYLTYCLFNFPVEAKAMEHHIFYKQSFPLSFSPYATLIYVIATVVPHFISSIRRMWMFGSTVFISYLITAVFYTNYIVSVWCFFASFISISIFAILYLHNKTAQIGKDDVLEQVIAD